MPRQKTKDEEMAGSSSDEEGQQGGEEGLSDSSDDDDAPPVEPDQLYDQDADDEDEKWVEKKRQGRQSDAILNCPCCFTTVCIDCQQHEKYHHQYRAMFVMNVQVDKERVVHPTGGGQDDGPGSRKRKAGAAAPEQPKADAGPQDAYHPLVCEGCGTEVGVQDPKDGLYIFFNVFPSNA